MYGRNRSTRLIFLHRGLCFIEIQTIVLEIAISPTYVESNLLQLFDCLQCMFCACCEDQLGSGKVLLSCL